MTFAAVQYRIAKFRLEFCNSYDAGCLRRSSTDAPCPEPRCAATQEFMSQHDFKGIPDFLGASLPYFTTHMELVCARCCTLSRIIYALYQCLQSSLGIRWAMWLTATSCTQALRESPS